MAIARAYAMASIRLLLCMGHAPFVPMFAGKHPWRRGWMECHVSSVALVDILLGGRCVLAVRLRNPRFERADHGGVIPFGRPDKARDFPALGINQQRARQTDQRQMA